MSKPRKRRAAPIDLYKSCQLGGDCFPDVQNKIEGKTLADRLLQIFSSVLYFGGLGIGSGKGTGGSTGYKPFGNVPRSGITLPETVKPTIPVDPLGGADVIPLNVLDASAPSVVPLVDGVPDTTVISSGTGPTVEIGDLDLTTTIDSAETTVARGDHPAVIDVSEEGASVIDVQNGPPPAKRLQVDTLLQPPETTDLVVPATTSYRDSNINVFVDTFISGETIGAEYIPLSEINLMEEFEIQEPYIRTSTPGEAFNRATTRAKDLYHRFVKQVPTQSLETIAQPSRQVTFQFENPAFSDDVTLTFNQDLEEVTAAPNADFRDIQRLSRPRVTATDSGTVRYSRLGQRASMQTRSGLVIGEKVHFYYDLSEIHPSDTIELRTFAETSADSVVQNALIESTLIDDLDFLYPDEVLDDTETNQFDNAQLVFPISTLDESLTEVVVSATDLGLGLYVPDLQKGISVSYPIPGSNVPTVLPGFPASPLIPSSVDTFGEDFIIDPFFLRRKRKRTHFY